ncbi:MAG: hypothetical protein ABSG62_02090 [Terracidiphilus sp.]|jgi:hypothetical protein
MILLDNPIPRDWLDWTNASVGGVGLLLTIAAIVQATGAKRAAKEAREAIWQREASDSFSELGGLAGELVQLLQFERPSEAAVRVRDLLAHIPRDRARFARFLAADSDKLKAVEAVFRKLALQLSAPGFLEKKDEFQAAVQEVLGANSVLSEVYGRLLARLDEEGK